jgi:hypothetical protein
VTPQIGGVLTKENEMPRPTTRPTALTDRLAALFGDDLDCPTAILAALETGRRDFTPSELVEATDHRLVDVMVAVARLTADGLIAHPSIGKYCFADSRQARRAG